MRSPPLPLALSPPRFFMSTHRPIRQPSGVPDGSRGRGGENLSLQVLLYDLRLFRLRKRILAPFSGVRMGYRRALRPYRTATEF